MRAWRRGRGASDAASRDVVVLSAGGNRGAVQVGMLQVLLERGIDPVGYVGCSVGALNAAFMASGSTQERTAGPGSDVDLRLILDDDTYDALMAGTPDGFATLLDFALAAYVRELTGLPIDFQVQRMTEANERHAGKQRNPLGGRSLTNWAGDARPEPKRCACNDDGYHHLPGCPVVEGPDR